MSFQFISLDPEPPEGFEYKQPTKRDLLSNLVAVYARDLATVMERLNEFRGRVQGAVVTPAEKFTFSELWPGLWHLETGGTAGIPLCEMLAMLFESMDRTRETMDLCNTLKVDLNRSRVSQEQTQKSYNENIERLGQKVEDLRQEIEHRKQAELAIKAGQDRARLQRTAIAILAVDPSITGGDVDGAVQRVTETLARVVQVSRASVWRFSEDNTELRCVDLFNSERGEHSDGAVLKTVDFPEYFDTLRRDSRISAGDARAHPATHSFTDKYLDPMGITSMLDAAIMTGGQLTGVVCLEHTGEPRDWHSDEEAFASTIASLVSLTIANARRILAMEEADRTLALIEATLESTDNGIVVLDADGHLIVYNRKFPEIWRIQPELLATADTNALRQHMQRHLSDKDQLNAIRDQLIQEPNLETTGLLELADGRTLEYSTRPMSFDVLSNGRVFSFRDITKQTQSARDLQHLRNYLTNIIDSMPSILIGMDNEFKVTQWNRMAELSTGIPPHQALGQSLDRVAPRLIPEIDRIRSALESGHVRYDPKQPRRGSCGVIYEDITVYPLVANGVEGAVIRIDDVTEQVRLEEMMIQSEKMLSVGGLAAGMAHEINNPLAGLLQSANNVIRRLTDRDLKANRLAAEEAGISMADLHGYLENRRIMQLLEVIKDSGTRMAVIVENMLSFARKSDSTPGMHDPVTLVERTIELAATDYDLKKKYDFKAIEIEKHFAEGLPEIPCESSKIQQVLLNILRNGAHAMHEERLKRRRMQVETPPSRLSISLGLEDAAGMLRIEIADNGPGMDEERRKRIFEPFFTTKPVGEGTGLGLSVSYFIVTENHGGTMAVESEPGRGSRFIIRLPVSKP